ncbi:phage major capsid protein [Bradyrhizobium sp. B097]|uniref:phage major capsid protein n=1 Tax=Bradyrhizobium sp. B097 TaxID=3140244 RepID=UPI003183C845
MLLKSNRTRAFTGPHAEQKAERVGYWAKAIMGDDAARMWCVDHGIGLTKATSGSTNSVGGFLAPQDFDAAIINVREAMGAFRQGAEIRPARSDGQVRPRRSGGLVANFVTEGAPIPESSFQLDVVESAQKKFAILGRASSELFEDSAADLGEFLTSEVGYAFASKEDDCGFNGDGTSAYVGMSGLATKLVGLKSSVAAGTGVNTFLTITATDIANLMAGVIAAAIPGAAWYTSATGYAQTLCRLAAVSGGLVATQRPDGTISANYLGFPVRFSGKLPDVPTSLTGKPMLFFGNLAMSSVLVERQQQTILAISRDRAMDADQVLVRGVQRCDIINHTVGDASTRGPVAMLVGTA